MKQSPLAVLVLHEAIGPEARPDELDTLAQVEQVSAALRDLGMSVSIRPTSLDLEATWEMLNEQRPDCVFNLVESLGGDGRLIHFIPALLRSADLAFTGCDGDAMYLSSQKQMAKNWMRLNGIQTPLAFSGERVAAEAETCWIVKSLWEHASFGMDDGCVVSGVQAAQARLEESVARYGGEWFAEQFVAGREFNISVLEQDGQPRVLPIAEITFDGLEHGKPQIVGYAAKWNEESPEFRATPRVFPVLPQKLADALTGVARKCWERFGLNGYARVDIRVDERGVPWVLEINANPCISRDAGFAAAAQQAGIGYAELVGKIVRAALKARPSGASEDAPRANISLKR